MQKQSQVVTKQNLKENKKGPFSSGVGKRKTSVASAFAYYRNPETVFVKDKPKKKKSPNIIVNGMDYDDYFSSFTFSSRKIFSIFKLINVENLENVLIKIKLRGGGKRSGIDASVLAVANAFSKVDKGYRQILRDNGYLTRDYRVKAAKKTGFYGARRRPQTSKR
jgi:ribosomal protein S9